MRLYSVVSLLHFQLINARTEIRQCENAWKSELRVQRGKHPTVVIYNVLDSFLNS